MLIDISWIVIEINLYFIILFPEDFSNVYFGVKSKNSVIVLSIIVDTGTIGLFISLNI